MTDIHPRIIRERRTVEAMISLYCHEQHTTGAGLCRECEVLADYAWQRLLKCPFQQGKTTCARCPVHCYKPDMREQIRAVMRTAGPRMLFRHPVLALLHLLDGLRKKPIRIQEVNARFFTEGPGNSDFDLEVERVRET